MKDKKYYVKSESYMDKDIKLATICLFSFFIYNISVIIFITNFRYIDIGISIFCSILIGITISFILIELFELFFKKQYIIIKEKKKKNIGVSKTKVRFKTKVKAIKKKTVRTKW